MGHTEVRAVANQLILFDDMMIDSVEQGLGGIRRVNATRLVVAICLATFTLLALSAWLSLRSKNALGIRGAVDIHVAPDIEVYVGDRLVGLGPVELTWDDLLGSRQNSPLVVPVSGSSQTAEIGEILELNIARLAGEGARIVWSRGGMSGSSGVPEPFTFAWNQVLVRRANNQLDLITVLDGRFHPRSGSPMRFLLPIRLGADSADLFFDPGVGGVYSRRALPGTRIGSALRLSLRVVTEPGPEQFANELEDRGLWKPESE